MNDQLLGRLEILLMNEIATDTPTNCARKRTTVSVADGSSVS